MSRTRGNTCPSIPIQVESANCNLGELNDCEVVSVLLML